jgi:hypothetical protein
MGRPIEMTADMLTAVTFEGDRCAEESSIAKLF